MGSRRQAVAAWLGVRSELVSGVPDELLEALVAKMNEEHASVLIADLSGHVTQQISQLRAEARTDHLTGQMNRRGIREAAEAALGDRPGPDQPALILVDVDQLKQVNDRFGHDAGDALLQAVANALRGAVRSDDAVGRWGGDEFLIVCRRSSPDGLGGFCCRLESAVAAAVLTVGEQTITPSVSTGGAIAEPGACVEDVFHAADAALYERKRQRSASSF